MIRMDTHQDNVPMQTWLEAMALSTATIFPWKNRLETRMRLLKSAFLRKIREII